jgi:ABC-type glycerol-3-phosphate transport system permease component
VPPDLLEAARVDGCNEFRIYWQILLPLLRPGLGALGVWTFINSYNSFLSLIAIGNPDRFTLPLGLQALFGERRATSSTSFASIRR